jgi:hypothetical protein
MKKRKKRDTESRPIHRHRAKVGMITMGDIITFRKQEGKKKP